MDFVDIFSFLVMIACVLLLIGLFMVFVYLYFMTDPKPSTQRFESEKTFVDAISKKRIAFPSIDEAPSVELSVVVPAYNEQERLPAMLNEALEYLQDKKKKKKKFSYEILIVDDGSRDKTTETGLDYSEKYGVETVRVLTLAKNRGKGGAVRMGVLSARGEYILFADADGATTFEDLEKLEREMSKHCGAEATDVIVCGSRAHLEEEAIAQRSLFRTFLMKGFHFLVWFLCVKGIRDTQCGFKLLSRSAAKKLFNSLHVERWAFDVELLYMAQCLNMKILEVAVRWQEIEGSKMVPVWSWLQMGRDLLFIRLRYVFGLWKISASN